MQSDYYRDSEIDVWGYYRVSGKQIELIDVCDDACNNSGAYKYNICDDKLYFTVINDSCDSRRIGLSGVWPRKK